MNLSFLVAPETIPPIVVDRRNPDQKKHSTIITICFQNLGNVKKITNQQHNRQRLQNHNKPTTQKNLKKVCKSIDKSAPL